MRLPVLILLVFVGVFGNAQAQYFDKTYSLALDVSAPLSNTNYVNEISARGFRFGYREMISERVFGGIDLNNNTYTRHKPRRTYTNGSSAITTDLFNYAYVYGLTLSGDYFFKTEQRFMPYAGLGVGASYISYRQFFNVYSNQGDSWGVLVKPHGGFIYRLKEDSGWAFQVALHYDYSSAKSEELGLDAFNSIGIQVGVIILDW